MYPTISAATSTAFSLSVTSMPVGIPSGVAAGKLILAIVSVRTGGTWTNPSGFTTIGQQNNGGSVGQVAVFAKVASGSEGTSQTWTTSAGTSATWQTFLIDNWHGTTLPEVAFFSGDSVAVNPPNLTPSWGSADTLWVAASGHAAASATAYSAGPSGYSGFLNSGASSGGAAVSLGAAYRTNTAASEDPSAFSTTGGSNRWFSAMTIGIRPGSGTTTTTTTAGTTGRLKVFNGTSNVAKPAKVWNGTAFVTKPVKWYNGTSWVTTTY